VKVNNNIMEVIQKWVDEANISQAELARRTNKTTGAISLIFSGQRKPSVELLVAIAKACGRPPSEALSLAGLLPPKSPKDEFIEKIIHELDQLPEDEREEIYQYIQLRRQIVEKKGAYSANPQAQERPSET
jgi:transcriptional regulator with XRE-family HTH domain